VGTLTARLVTPIKWLTAAAVVALLALCALLVAARVALGWYPMIVYTGSMAPTIPIGAVVVVRPVAAAQLAVGDVISFRAPQTGNLPVTHRITEIERLEDATGAAGWQVITKGDANLNPDVWRVGAEQLTGRVEYSLPYVGYFLISLAQPPVRFTILAVIVVLALARVANHLNQPEPARAGAEPTAAPTPVASAA
jgi:signal peptidase I